MKSVFRLYVTGNSALPGKETKWKGDPKQSTVVILNWYDRYQNLGLRWLEVARVLQRRELWRKRPPEIYMRVLLSLCWTQDTHSQGKTSQSQVLWGTVGTEMNTSQTSQRTDTNQFPLSQSGQSSPIIQEFRRDLRRALLYLGGKLFPRLKATLYSPQQNLKTSFRRIKLNHK